MFTYKEGGKNEPQKTYLQSTLGDPSTCDLISFIDF